MKRILALMALALAALAGFPARANDGIFPPLPAAAPVIAFDGKGFTIRDRPTFVASGSIHYPRVPRALWRDRLTRLKRAGFNTVETYAFWNYHEPKEGAWDFAGEKDLGAFLDLAHDLGLYAIVRVGPYVCAEWDSGGYPVWLRFKPGLRVREDNAPFIRYTNRWYEKVMPIVAKRQVHRGGPVIMVQLENEHPRGWGTEMPNAYFRHLLEKATTLGIQVPTFFSGLHHAHDPAGDKPWDTADRSNPWFSTEFWAGWFDRYGPADRGSLRFYDRATWKMIAYGGSGYNVYMLHGGTNFAQWGNQENDASYDYGAAIGQAGDLRPLYYRFKRANLFAHSFADILRNSVDATDELRGAVPGVKITARKSTAGMLLFLDNPSDSNVTARLRGVAEMHLLPGEILPVVRNAALTDGVRIEESAARILLVRRKGRETTMVLYGPSGDSGAVAFRRTASSLPVPDPGTELKQEEDPAVFTLRVAFREGAPSEHRFSVGETRVRVLGMSAETADRTWLIEHPGGPWIVCGPDYVSGYAVKDGRIAFLAENRDARRRDVVAYGPNGQVRRYLAAPTPAPAAAPALNAWEVRRADREAQSDFNDRAWKTFDAPPEMGADGSISPYAWYCANIEVARAGTYQLRFHSLRDRFRLYVNGKPVSTGDTLPSQTLRLDAGRNSLAVFAAHDGRDKLFNYIGPLSERDPKGLSGAVTLSPAPAQTVRMESWLWRLAASAEEAAHLATENRGDRSEWRTVDTKRDVFNGRRGFAVYRTSLPALTGAHREVWFENVDDRAIVYLNGRKVTEHHGWGQPFGASLDAAWRANGPNELSVVVENTDGAGGLFGSVEAQAYAGAVGAINGQPVRGWKLRGGPGADASPAGWSPFQAVTNRPAFYRTRFILRGGPPTGAAWRFFPGGLGRGMAWLNGHNIGRYPDRLIKDGLYLPPCWLKEGANTLEVFDEAGGDPESACIVVETGASRTLALYVVAPG